MHESVLASRNKEQSFLFLAASLFSTQLIKFLIPRQPIFLRLSLDKMILSVLSRIFRHVRDNKDHSSSF